MIVFLLLDRCFILILIFSRSLTRLKKGIFFSKRIKIKGATHKILKKYFKTIQIYYGWVKQVVRKKNYGFCFFFPSETLREKTSTERQKKQSCWVGVKDLNWKIFQNNIIWVGVDYLDDILTDLLASSVESLIMSMLSFLLCFWFRFCISVSFSK